ncbi:hypothetical protein SRHO_G00317480 [Serrasalmus rhombeus]
MSTHADNTLRKCGASSSVYSEALFAPDRAYCQKDVRVYLGVKTILTPGTLPSHIRPGPVPGHYDSGIPISKAARICLGPLQLIVVGDEIPAPHPEVRLLGREATY